MKGKPQEDIGGRRYRGVSFTLGGRDQGQQLLKKKNVFPPSKATNKTRESLAPFPLLRREGKCKKKMMTRGHTVEKGKNESKLGK